MTTYEIEDNTYTGATYTLNLNNDLEANYFAMVTGHNDQTGSRGPDDDGVRVSGDPFSNFSTGTSADAIELTRGSSVNDWIGSVTIVECLGACTTDGFVLSEVVEHLMVQGTANILQSDVVTLAASHSAQTVPFGARWGGGAATTGSGLSNNEYAVSLGVRILKSSTDELTFERYGGTSRIPREIDVTVYVVEWGSNWTVQEEQFVNWNVGGAGADSTGEFTTQTITSVTRDNTWVWMAPGTSQEDGLGDGAFGKLLTLGDGVNQSTSETTVALGSESSGGSRIRRNTVYVMEHTDLAVDYRHVLDGNAGPTSGVHELTQSIDSANGAESYDNVASDVRYMEGFRFPLVFSSSDGVGQAYSRAGGWAARITADSSLKYWRAYGGQEHVDRLQVVDFANNTREEFLLSGTSDLTLGTSIRFAINNSLQVTTGTVAADGTWTIQQPTFPVADDILTVWADSVSETNETTALLKYSGSGDVAGVTLNKHELSIGTSGTLTMAISITDLNGQYDNIDDEDIMHAVTSGTLKIDEDDSYADDDLIIESVAGLTFSGAQGIDAHDITLTGTLTSGGAGTIRIDGSWMHTGTFVSNTETIHFVATTSETFDSDGDTFYNMTFNGSGGTWILQDHLDLNGNLNLTQGTLDVKSGSNYDINIAGNWINNAIFTARNGTVVFDGGDQSVSGSTTFYNLTKEDSTNDATEFTLTFDSTATQTVTNVMTLSGLDSDDKVIVASDSPATQWGIDPQGSRTVKFLDVTDSNNTSGTTIDCTNGCVDNGNTTDWNFVAGSITISGIVYTDEGSTNIGSGKTVAVSINGGAFDTTTETNGSGAYSITTSSAVGATAVVTLYLENETENAVTVSVADGNDMTNMDLYQNYLIARQDNSGSLTNANLNTANNSDADVTAIYDVTASVLTVVNGNEMIVPSGHSFAPGNNVNIGTSGTTSTLDVNGTLSLGTSTLNVFGSLDSAGAFNGGSGDIDVDGSFTVTAGSFTSTSGNVLLAGNVDIDSGFFTNNSGNVTFDGAALQTVSLGTNTFNTLTVTNASGAGVTFDEAFTTANFTNNTVNSTIKFQQSTTFTITNTLTLAGSSGNEITVDSVDGSTKFTFDVPGGAQSVSFVDVSNSQSSTNNITAASSIDTANTDSAESAPKWIFPSPAALSMATGRFTLSAGTGNLAITGVGFAPSAYILILSKNAVDDDDSVEGTGVGGMVAMGMTDGTSEYCMSSGVEDNQFASDVSRRGFSNNDAVLCNIDIGDANQTVRGEASHVSMDADGFTINRSVTFTEPTSVLVEYVAFGGADLSAHVNVVDLADTVDTAFDETNPGFEPDVVLTSYIGYFNDSNNGNNDDSSLSFGWAVNPTAQSSDNQFSVMVGSMDGQAATVSATRFDNTYAGTSFRDGAMDAGYEIGSFDASGFSVTTRVTGATADEIMMYMALDLGSSPQIFSTQTTTPTSTGSVTNNNPRFQPGLLLGIGGAVATTANTLTDSSSISIGLTDGTNSSTVFWHDENSADPTNSHSRTTTSQFMSAYSGSGLIDWETTITEFTESGWTINYSDGASASYLQAFLAIGTDAASTTISGTVYSDKGVTNIGSGKTVALSINGDDPTQTAETDGSGNFTFTVPTSSTNILTFYIDDETEQGVTVTESDGNVLSGVDIYQDHLIVRHDNSGALLNSDLATADNNADTDITDVYTMSTNALIVSDGFKLFIPTTHTFAPADTVTADALEIDGVFTMAANAVTVSGTFDAVDGSFTSSGVVTFDGTLSTTIESGSSAFNDLTFNGSGGTWILEGALDVNGNLTITDGSLDVKAAENNTINLAGSWSNNGTFNAQNGTVTFDASSGTTDITPGMSAFYNVVFNDGGGSAIFELEDDIDVDGALTITGGNLDTKSSENNGITLAGNWINNDTFTARNSTVTLDGTNQALTGSTDFYNLSKIEISNDSTSSTLTIDNTATIGVTGIWTLTGLDSDDLINLVSDSPGNQWDVNPTGARALSFLDVIDSNNIDGTIVECTNGCVDSGNNTNWNFTAGTITISGTVYIDEGVTTIGTGRSVSVSINGAAAEGTDMTDASGQYSVSTSVTVGSGAVVTVYLDGAAEDGVTVFLSDGNDVTNLDVYQDYLIIRADNGSFVSNTNLDTANNSGDTEIDTIYTMSGSSVTTPNGVEILVPTGHEYRPGADVNVGTSGATSAIDIDGSWTGVDAITLTVYGTLDSSGTFSGSSATVDVNGDMNASGMFTSTSQTLTVSGTVDIEASAWTHNSGTVLLDGSQQQTFSAGSNSFNALTSTNASSAGVIFDEAFATVDFTNTTAGSKLTFQQSTTFTVSGDLTLSGGSGNEIVLDSVNGSTRFTFDVTGGNQTVTFVDVSNSQSSSNNISASNSNDTSNTDSAESAPHWIFPMPANLSIATGRFTVTAGTGNLAITGVGFTPSAYILFLTKNDVDDADSAEGTGNGSMLSIGMTDGTRQYCMASGVEDNQDTMDVGRRGFDVNDEVLCNIDVGDNAQTVRGEASHVSMDVDGFTINRGVTFTEPTNVIVEYVAFGGSDLTVRADVVDLANTVNTSVDVTAPGFEPDVILTSFIGYFNDVNSNANADDDSLSFGWAVNDSIQATDNQFSIMKASRDAQATAQVLTRFDDTRAGASVRDSGTDAAYELNSYDASGFSVTTRLAAATTDEIMMYLAMDLGADPQVYSTQSNALTSTGNEQNANARFQPIFLMGMGSSVATVANSNASGGSLSLGITDGTNSYAMAVHDENNAGISNSHSKTTSTKFMTSYANNGSTDWEVSLTSFDTNGWTLNYDDAATASYLTAFLAIGTTAATSTISGVVYTDEGSTNIGAGKTVALSINGADPIQMTETGASGEFNFSAAISNNDVLTVYLDDETEKALTVTVTSGGLITDMDLYQDRMIIRNDKASTTSNISLATADNNADSDITTFYSMSSNALTVNDGYELFIPTSHVYTPGDSVTVDSIDINGTFIMEANAITVSGTFDATGGGFSSTATVTFDATNSVAIYSDGDSFNNISFNGASGTWILEDTLDVNGNLTISNGSLDVNASENNLITIAGAWSNSATFIARSGTVTFDAASGTQDINSGSSSFYNLVFNDGGGTAVFELEDTLDVLGTLTITGGTLDANSAEDNAISLAGNWINADTFVSRNAVVTFDGTMGSPTIESGGDAFNDVTFDDTGSGIIFTLEDSLDVNGDVMITSGTLDVKASENNTINVFGSWTNTGSFNPQNGTVTFDATSGAPTIESGGDAFYDLTFNDADNNRTFTLEDALDVNNNLTITGGNLDVKSGENNSINIAGNWLNSDIFTPRNGIVIFDGTSGTVDIQSGSSSFYNFTINDGGGSLIVELEDAFDVNGTITITGGALDVKSGEDNTINLAGHWINADTFTAQSGTVTFDATSGAPTIESGASAFNDVIFNDGGGTAVFTLEDTFDVDGNLTITGGSLDTNVTENNLITLAGNWTNSDIFLPQTGTVTFDAASGTVDITSGSSAFYNIEINDAGGTATFEMEDTLDVNGTLNIIDGILSANVAENNDLTLAGNWIITTGSFAAQNGMVTLDGMDQALTGSTVFFDFTKAETTDDSSSVTLTWDSAGTFTIGGAWTVNGLDADDLIFMRSSNPGSDWDLNPSGTRAISFLDVQDSNNFSGTTVQCTNGCVDSGSNVDWNFTAGTVTISGTVYSDEGVTNIGAGKTVAVSINGAVRDGTDETDGSGGYSITTTSSVGSGAVITLYLENETEDGVTVTLSDGNDLTGLDLYQDHLIVRADNDSFIANASLDTANNNADGDIDALYTMSGSDVTTVNGKTLFVPAGYEYRPGANVTVGSTGMSSVFDVKGMWTGAVGVTLTVNGTLNSTGTFVGDSSSIDVNGDLDISSGPFTSTSGTMSVAGTLDLAGSVFTHNSGTVLLDGSQQQTLAAGANTFNNLTTQNATASGVIFTEAFTTANFTNTTAASYLTFQQSTNFTITNALTLTGSGGNLVALNSVDGSTRFTLDITGSSQSVDFVSVSNSQVSSNNITANNSSNGVNNDSGEAAPHWIFATPANLSIATGRFTLTSGTGNLAVTGVGFAPSAYILILSKNSSDDVNSSGGTGNGSLLAIGMTDGTREFCMASGVEDGQGTSDVGRRAFNDAVVCNIDVGDDTQTVLGEASHFSFDADGFTIAKNTTFY